MDGPLSKDLVRPVDLLMRSSVSFEGRSPRNTNARVVVAAVGRGEDDFDLWVGLGLVVEAVRGSRRPSVQCGDGDAP